MTPSYSLGDPTPRHGRKWHQSSLPSANMVSPKGIVSSTSTQRVDIISHTYTYYMYIYYVYVYIYIYIYILFMYLFAKPNEGKKSMSP